MTAPDARRRGAAGAGPARVVHSRRTRLGPRTRAGVRGGRGESICTWLRGGGGSRVGCCSQSGAARYWGDRASRRPRRGSAKAAAQKAEAEKVAAEKVAAEKVAAESAEAEKAAGTSKSKKSKAPNGKGSKGQDGTVDLDDEEDDGEDDDPLAQFKDKTLSLIHI